MDIVKFPSRDGILDRFRKSLLSQQHRQMTIAFRAQYININNEDIVISETMRDGHTRTQRDTA